MTGTTATQGIRLRADAARNRELILCAAATAYAARGCDVSLEEVARLSGVGVGTVYRRFPTKSALLNALFEDKMNAYAEHAERMAQLAHTEPWAAFSSHVTFLLEEQARDLAFSDLLRDPSATSVIFQKHLNRTLAASRSLVRSASAAGVLCPGFTHADLLIMADANHGIVQRAGERAAAASARFAVYILGAFRAQPAER